jgi:hypothetical protein
MTLNEREACHLKLAKYFGKLLKFTDSLENRVMFSYHLSKTDSKTEALELINQLAVEFINSYYLAGTVMLILKSIIAAFNLCVKCRRRSTRIKCPVSAKE